MADEFEVIRRQMADTRAGLSEKLDDLELQIRDDVHAAATKVTETVDMVMEQIDSTKASIQHTVEAVKNACDVAHQVDKRPWAMMAGAAAVGMIGGRLLRRDARVDRPHTSFERSSISDDSEEEGNGKADRFTPAELRAPSESATARRSFGKQDHASLAKVVDAFRPEILILKGLAIGALFGVLRDAVVRSAPGTLEQPLGTVFDGLTVRLGGQPIRGQVIERAAPKS